MAMRYICIQFCAFAVAVLGLSLMFGIGLPVLLASLGISVAVAATVAWRDLQAGRYVLQGENLFVSLSDTQLRECYEAYLALEAGADSRSMLFYKLVTRYEDASPYGYEKAAADLTGAVAVRWGKADAENLRAG